MSEIDREKLQRNVTTQAIGFGLGVASGALTGNPQAPRLGNRCPQTAVDVGQAVGAAVVNGANASETLAAVGDTLTSKARKAFGG